MKKLWGAESKTSKWNLESRKLRLKKLLL